MPEGLDLASNVMRAGSLSWPLTDPDSRSMATSGHCSGVIGYHVQVAVDTEHHLIVHHEVGNVGSDRSQLSSTATAAKEVVGVARGQGQPSYRRARPQDCLLHPR